MEKLEERLHKLSGRHCAALEWFMENANSDQPWPAPLSDGTFLVTKAKGIYKPSWSDYALSVRQTLNSSYQDLDPVRRPDGTWAFSYYQENSNPADRDASYTNRALLKCCQDKIPIGVMRQVSVEPQVRYHILGLALVSSWENGYFFLEGFSREGYSWEPGPKAEVDMFIAEYEANPSIMESFNPQDILEGRKRIISTIVQRQGQSEFRQKLLEIYDKRCLITGCNVVEALEAAHIIPYNGIRTNSPSNGLLLRADIHTLFDLGLLAVATKTLTVLVSPHLRNSTYSQISGTQLVLPHDESVWPSREALDQHRKWAGL